MAEGFTAIGAQFPDEVVEFIDSFVGDKLDTTRSGYIQKLVYDDLTIRGYPVESFKNSARMHSAKKRRGTYGQ